MSLPSAQVGNVSLSPACNIFSISHLLKPRSNLACKIYNPTFTKPVLKKKIILTIKIIWENSNIVTILL